jgi:hypothetical protein
MKTAPQELEKAIREWFASLHLEIHETHYQFDHGFFAWRYYGDRRTLTLWVAERTLEDYPPSAIIGILRDFEPHALMDTHGHVHLHVNSTDSEFGAYMRSTFTPTGE